MRAPLQGANGSEAPKLEESLVGKHAGDIAQPVRDRSRCRNPRCRERCSCQRTLQAAQRDHGAKHRDNVKRVTIFDSGQPFF